jgi:ankyrin repeat protein
LYSSRRTIAIGHLAVTKLLLEKGADLKLKTIYGETALHVAVKKWHLTIARLLLEKGADVESEDSHGGTS